MNLASLAVMIALPWTAAAASSFWEQKPPEEWTVEEVQSIFESSPWSRTLRGRREELQIHLASALPMRQAEVRERAFQKRPGAPTASHEEYLAMVEEGKYIVVAVRVKNREAFSDAGLVERMQKDSQLKSNRKSFPLVTYFPPSASDPYLRLVFPRVEPEKSLDFLIVIPGALDPYHQVSFYRKDMAYRGKLEY